MGIKITLPQEELEAIVVAHVRTNYGINIEGKIVTAKFTSTRKGTGGTTVDVEISNPSVGQSSQTHVLDNMGVAEANNRRSEVIRQTGADILGHSSEQTAAVPTGPSGTPETKAKADPIEASVDDVEVPVPTPETVGHETTKSLFD